MEPHKYSYEQLLNWWWAKAHLGPTPNRVKALPTSLTSLLDSEHPLLPGVTRD